MLSPHAGHRGDDTFGSAAPHCGHNPARRRTRRARSPIIAMHATIDNTTAIQMAIVMASRPSISASFPAGVESRGRCKTA